MKVYFEFIFSPLEPEEAEILIAELDEIGFYAYENEDQALKAYSKDSIDFDLLKPLLPDGCYFRMNKIEERDWNQQWEENFQPIRIDDFVNIRAAFHPKVEDFKYDIVITPRMSFGTGHHATTRLMMRQMKTLDLKGKTLIDFGTGTGILAILAEKMGAEKVYAIDNDEWSIHNALQNIYDNNCTKITVINSDRLENLPPADVLLANINLNILLSNSSEIAGQIVQGGIVVLSGILIEDEGKMIDMFVKNRCILINKESENGWLSLIFNRV